MSNISRKPRAPDRDILAPGRVLAPVGTQEREQQNALLLAAGYTWHPKVYRGRTYRNRWVLLAPDGTPTPVTVAMANIAISIYAASVSEEKPVTPDKPTRPRGEE